jgi:3-deoxy-D-manno-octulosonic-acid transferase
MQLLAFWLYRFLLAPLTVFLVHIVGLFAGEKIKTIIQRRKSGKWTFEKKPGTNLKNGFWVHAASGEIEYARPLIRELKKKYPEVPLIVTYSSPSAERILRNLTEVDAWGLAPWDLFWSCKKFVRSLRPRAVFFARTDVWPELITQIHNERIPAILFSATFAENSSRLRGLGKLLTSYSLKLLTKTFVADADDVKVLAQKGINTPAELAGDTRYDQVFHRLENPQKVKSQLRPQNGEKIFVAGSTWPEDENVILPWFAKHRDDFKLLLAPHEISKDHLEKIEYFLRQNNIECDFYSRSEKWEKPVLVLDQIGILAELYTWGSWAFVGGSFKKQVHSVMEPLAVGLPVWVGPFHQNNREALIFKKIKKNIPLVTEIKDMDDLEKSYSELIPQLAEIKSLVSEEIRLRQGATPRIMAWVDSLPKTSL